jgi:hypothetical protein
VIGNVLDLVGNGSGVGLDQARQRVGEGFPRDVETQDGRRDSGLQFGCEPRDETLGLERRIARRLGAEGVEVSRKVTVHAVRLDERHRGRDCAQELVGDRFGCCGRCRGSRSRLRRSGRGRRGLSVAERVEKSRETGMAGHDVAVSALEQAAPLAWDRVRIPEVLL